MPAATVEITPPANRKGLNSPVSPTVMPRTIWTIALKVSALQQRWMPFEAQRVSERAYSGTRSVGDSEYHRLHCISSANSLKVNWQVIQLNEEVASDTGDEEP